MEIKVTYSWIIYSCLIYGIGILGDRKIERRHAVSSCSENTDDKFSCSSGLCIEWSLICDGHNDCSDGSDETKELCSIYELGTNITMDCGKVDIQNRVISKEGNKSLIKVTPWAVDIYLLKTEYRAYISSGSIIMPNIIISVGYPFWQNGITSKQTPINDGRFKIVSMGWTWKEIEQIKKGINVSMIYLTRDNKTSAAVAGFKYENIAVIVLANKISFTNGFNPICIDWYNKYDAQKEAQITTIGARLKNNRLNMVIQGFFPYMENSTCMNRVITIFKYLEMVTSDMICIELEKDLGINEGVKGAGLGILHSNTYFLTGLSTSWSTKNNAVDVIYVTSIKNYVPWIRGILNRHVIPNSCILPTVEGVKYSYEGSNEILFHGTLINRYVTVIENCDVGYHKAYPYGFRICQGKGKWLSNSDTLCLKMCPPLLSDSVDITCSYNGKYANCSNLSIPDTIATPSCKPTYALPNGQKETPHELRCQSNGMWSNQLFECDQMNRCVLPSVEGVVYTFDNSNESLSHGTLIDHTLTVNENCKFGYHNAYPNSFRVCQRNGKWKTVSDKLCFKMCPPLLSDSLDIECSYNGKNTNCLNLSIPGTIATPSCKSTYALPNGQNETPLELHCQSNGMWSNQLYRCVPYCGKVYNTSLELISNGKTALNGTAPWNVGVYRFDKNISNYDLICGGSIISPNLVISAAHCFWKPGISRNISINNGEYKIAVGKYHRNFTYTDNSFTKIYDVKIVYLKERYYGVGGLFAEDIAVVLLQNKIFFSTGVAPICIDWNGNYNVVNGTQGKIAGWGKTEKDLSSPILLEAFLTYIDHDSCRKFYKNNFFQSYVTADKFCAGSASGQGVNDGDSGAGLSFLHSNSYYLTGVASNKEKDTNDFIAIFTEVKFHIQWIRGLYNEHY